ncbi:hypothetical protein ACLESO_51475, partial [Pyxidicoccus sp. 3LG]
MSRGEGAWHQENQRYLVAALGMLRAWLEQRLEARTGTQGDEEPAPPLDLHPRDTPPGFVSHLDQLTDVFSLSSFERAVLLLCAGVELDGGLATLLARAQGEPRKTRPTFALALAMLPG